MSFSLILLLIAITAAIVVYFVNKDKPAGSSAVANGTHDRYLSKPGIQGVRQGGVFSLRSFGDDMEDLDVSVTARHLYDEDGYQWIELEGETGGEKIWLTVEDDDGLELSVTLRKTTLEDIGLTKEQMQALTDDDQSKIDFNGRSYHFHDRGEAVFYPDADRGKGAPFTYWDFDAADKTRSLTVERWEDGTYECHICQVVKESQITVYSSGDA